jgi:hypothetical protein
MRCPSCQQELQPGSPVLELGPGVRFCGVRCADEAELPRDVFRALRIITVEEENDEQDETV